MTTNGRNGQSADNFNGGLGPPEPRALRAAVHTVAHIDKLNEPDLMVHQWSLCGHSSLLRAHYKVGLRCSRAALNDKTMAVELALTNSCATQGQVLPTGTGNIKVASGGLVGTFVGLSYSSLDASLAMETKPIHGKTKPEGNKNGQEMSGVMGMH